MFKALKCLWKGHVYVDSRSQPGTQVCVRCKHRKPFETFIAPPPVESGAEFRPPEGARAEER